MTKERPTSPGRGWWVLTAVLVVLTLHSGCSTSLVRTDKDLSPGPCRGVPDDGEWTLEETGNASWYGGKFHGRVTANGKRYNKWELTAAHRTLPFGTKLLVENLENNCTVEVVVTDRGPFKKGRILDLSRAAAGRAGMLERGVARVRLYRSSEQPERIDETVYTIQVGSFIDRDNAMTLVDRLSDRFENVHVNLFNDRLFRVRVGCYGSRFQAKGAKQKLQSMGLSTWVTASDDHCEKSDYDSAGPSS